MTSTDSAAHTRPRSLRTRSTIIRFSCRSFPDPRSSAAAAASSAASRPRGRVPLMGRDSARSAPPASRAMRRKRSGEEEQTESPAPQRRSAANGAALQARSRR